MRCLIALLLILGCIHVNSLATQSPTWITSNYFRAGNEAVIKTLTGNTSTPNWTFTFSSALNGYPNLAYGIKNYRGNDYFGQQFYQIRKIGLNQTNFQVEVQIYGITNLWVLTVAYIAVDPSFPHHFNSFDNVALNYSSGIITNISISKTTMTYFSEIIDYSQQASGRLFNNFTLPLASNKIVLFITSLWIRGTSGNVVQVHIYPKILNQTHYEWNATIFKSVIITKLQFSQVIFNSDDVINSGKYSIVYEQWITDLNGGFKDIPYEFVDNFIMAVTDFEAVDSRCGFEYQWQFKNSSGVFGVEILYSWTITNTCGFSWARTSILYMKTWRCDPPYNYFNLTTNLCQDMCDAAFISNSTTYTCMPTCHPACINCMLITTASVCLQCNATLLYQVKGITCNCINGYTQINNTCQEICGDGFHYDLECDDGNLIDNDGCSSNCTVQDPFMCFNGSNVTASNCSEICGDGILINLPCDDGNNINGDGCSATCEVEAGYQCSGGNITSKSKCFDICGDGVVIIDACDDGNIISGDGCSSNCSIQTGFVCQINMSNSLSTCHEICGDGIKFYLSCDDGNLINGDGCSSICTIQNGYKCTGGTNISKSICSEVCGDGLVFYLECDDGNLINGDGCSSNCQIENNYNCTTNKLLGPSICFEICGDGALINLGCDDGNNLDGDGCSSNCTLEPNFNCSNGSLTSPSICDQICGDGRVYDLPCDDGNLIDGDGCSANCTVEIDFSCSGGSSNSPSKCFSTNAPSLELIAFYKDPLANSFALTLKIEPLKNTDNLTALLSFDFPFESVVISVDPTTGLAKLSFTYNQSLNSDHPLSITFNNSKVSSVLFLPQTTDNNLTLKLYNQQFYGTTKILTDLLKILAWLLMGTFAILFVSVSKLIAIQMVFVFQFAYCGLIMLKKVESLMDPFKQLWIVNGYNGLIDQAWDRILPPRIYSIFYKAEFISNFNCDFVLYLFPLLIGLILVAASKFFGIQKLEEWSKQAMKEWQISGMLFCQFQLIFAFVICLKHGNQVLTGALLGTALLLLLLFFVFIFYKWPMFFGQYKSFFKTNVLGQNFYAIVILYRLLLIFCMVSFSETVASAALTLVISVFWTALLFWLRIYESNVRPLVNNVIIVVFSMFLVYSRSELDSPYINFTTYLPLLAVSLLIFTFFFNLFFFIKHFLQGFKQHNSNKIVNEITENKINETKVQQFEQKIERKSTSNQKRKSKKGKKKLSSLEKGQNNIKHQPKLQETISDLNQNEVE